MADFYGYAFENNLFLDCDASLIEKILAELNRYLMMEDVHFENVSDHDHGLVLMGDDIPHTVESLFSTVPEKKFKHHWVHTPSGEKFWVIRKDRWNYPAVEVWGKSNELNSFFHKYNFRTLSPEEKELLRIESMTPKYGIDMTEENIPQEANLYEALSFTKGCYVGQETIARLQNRGHVNKTLVLLKLSGENVPHPKTAITLENGEEVGFVTSSIFSKKFQSPIAMGYVKYIYKDQTVFKIGSQRAELNPE